MSRLSCDLEWRSKSSDWQRWDRHLVGLPSQQTWWALIETFSEIITHLLFSWLRFVWPWSQVKVMLIITWCIRMFEAVPVPSVMMMTSIIFEESLARDRQTHTDTASSMLTFFQSLKTLKKRKKKKRKKKRLRSLKKAVSAPDLSNQALDEESDKRAFAFSSLFLPALKDIASRSVLSVGALTDVGRLYQTHSYYVWAQKKPLPLHHVHVRASVLI